MADFAELTLRVQSLEAEVAQRRLKELGGTSQKTERETKSLTRTFGRLAAGLAAGGGLIAGLKTVGGAAINNAKQFETLQVRLNAMFGSVDEGTERFKEFRNIAATTPFELQRVVEAGAQLRAFLGDAFQDEYLKNAADLAAFMGTDIVDAANAMGRAFAGGAGAADILRERGILNIIATKQEIDDFKDVTLEEFREAMFATLADDSTGIPGATDKLAETTEGALSNMKDAWSVYTAEIGERVLPTLKEGFNTTAEALRRMAETDLETTIRQLREMGVEAEFLATIEAQNTILEATKEQASLEQTIERTIRSYTGMAEDSMLPAYRERANVLLDIASQEMDIEEATERVREEQQAIIRLTKELAQEQARGENANRQTLADLQSEISYRNENLNLYSSALNTQKSLRTQTQLITQAERVLSGEIQRSNEELERGKDLMDQRKQSAEGIFTGFDREGRLAQDVSEFGLTVEDVFQTGTEAAQSFEKHVFEVDGAFQESQEATRDYGRLAEDAFSGIIMGAIRARGEMDIFNRTLERTAELLIHELIVQPFAERTVSSAREAFGFAKGGVFTNTIVDRPTLFPMAEGAGLMGESGPEAVVPLTRTPSGDLGVKSSGGGKTEVHVHNYNDSEVKVKEQTTNNGGTRIDVVIDNVIAKSIAQGGASARAMQSAFGLQRIGRRG